MSEVPNPNPLIRIEVTPDVKPAHVAQMATHMAGVISSPVSTELVRAIAKDCFDQSLSDIPSDMPTYEAKYQQALELGKRLFPQAEDSQRRFARTLIIPMLPDFSSKVFKSFYDIDVKKTALEKDVPIPAALDRTRDIHRSAIGHQTVVAGLTTAEGDPGFIWTSRSLKKNASRVARYENLLIDHQLDNTVSLSSIAFARHDPDGIGIYVPTSGCVIRLVRPGGEKETLLVFNGLKKQTRYRGGTSMFDRIEIGDLSEYFILLTPPIERPEIVEHDDLEWENPPTQT